MDIVDRLRLKQVLPMAGEELHAAMQQTAT
jgi:hypothetical protein